MMIGKMTITKEKREIWGSIRGWSIFSAAEPEGEIIVVFFKEIQLVVV